MIKVRTGHRATRGGLVVSALVLLATCASPTLHTTRSPHPSDPNFLTQPTSIPNPPTGINYDYPTGVGGSGHSLFTVVGEGFEYYQDRDYYIQPVSTSPANLATFTALGFDGAMGISTMNGGTAADPQTAHKLYTGSDYITFTTLRDLDVYVMYDTRGGTGPNDLTQDAPWLSSYGFNADIVTPTNPIPTRYFVETTDAVGRYKVYKNTYPTGSTVHLDGNRKGVTDAGIQTNYWVIIKKKDDYSSNSASTVAVSPSDITPPGEVNSLLAAAGNGTVFLSWTTPPDVDLDRLYLNYTPGGTIPFLQDKNSSTALLTGLTNGTLYTFTIKTADTSNNVSTGVTIQATPTALRKITYDGNGNSSGTPPVDSNGYTASQVLSVLGPGVLGRAGYSFGGWNTKADGTGSSYSTGQNFVMGANDAVLYAQWIPTALVTVNVALNLGSDAAITTTVPGTVIRGSPLNVSVAETFDSYQWYLDDSVTMVGNNASIIIDTSTLLPGLHTLMVAAAKNGVYSSRMCRFTVGNPTGVNISVSLSVGSESTVTVTVPSTVVRGANLNVSIAETFDSYQWYLDNGATLVGTTKTLSLPTGQLLPGLHTLAAVVGKNGSYTNATVRFTVGNPTGAAVNVTLSIGTEDLVSAAVPATIAKGTTLSVSAAQTFESYQWYLDDGATLVGSAKALSLATAGLSPGLHTLLLAVRKNGSYSSATYRFTVTN